MMLRKTALRLQNILLFFSALFLAFAYDRTRRIDNPRVVLVIQLAKLGDMVCTTPVFRAIKKQYPATRVLLVGDKINNELLVGNLDIDRYFVFARKDFCRLVRTLRKEKPNFACVIGPDFMSLLLAIFSGAHSVASFRVEGGRTTETRTYTLLRRFVWNTPYVFGTYAASAHLRLLEPIGIVAKDTTKYLYVNDVAKKSIAELLSKNAAITDGFLVGISPAAGHRTKQWPPERFAAVADYLIEKYGAGVILIGGPHDQNEAKAMLKALGNTSRALNTTGVLSVEELKALISRLDLFISVDTGPIYIAEAFGVPTIDITGPIDEREQPPIGKLHKVIVPKERKKPELFVMNARGYDYEEARRQVESITPEMVFSAIDELYPLIRKPGNS